MQTVCAQRKLVMPATTSSVLATGAASVTE
jgi:hypothetical protein